jgi:hypothetical protein
MTIIVIEFSSCLFARWLNSLKASYKVSTSKDETVHKQNTEAINLCRLNNNSNNNNNINSIITNRSYQWEVRKVKLTRIYIYIYTRNTINILMTGRTMASMKYD